MRPITFAIPGDIDTPTGGYRYDRALLKALAESGRTVHHLVLGGDFPAPSASEEEAARRALAAVPSEHALMVDGLAYGVLPELAASAPIVALVHHPLALETGVMKSDAERLRASETAALSRAAAVIVTSPTTKTILVEDYAVDAQTVAVALPGLDPSWAAIENTPTAPPLIVSVGSLTPRKGHDVLIAALQRLHDTDRDLDWQCHIIGSGTRDGDLAERLTQQVEAAGMTHRITLTGALSEAEIAQRYTGATLFALATRYEGFGMVFAEAMAAGLPVVGTTGGAVPDVVPHDAGLLVPPDDPAAFSNALRQMLTDRDLRDRTAAAARSAGARFSGWDGTARVVSDVVEALP